MMVVDGEISPSESDFEFGPEVCSKAYIHRLSHFLSEDHHGTLESSISLFRLLVD